MHPRSDAGQGRQRPSQKREYRQGCERFDHFRATDCDGSPIPMHFGIGWQRRWRRRVPETPPMFAWPPCFSNKAKRVTAKLDAASISASVRHAQRRNARNLHGSRRAAPCFKALQAYVQAWPKISRRAFSRLPSARSSQPCGNGRFPIAKLNSGMATKQRAKPPKSGGTAPYLSCFPKI